MCYPQCQNVCVPLEGMKTFQSGESFTILTLVEGVAGLKSMNGCVLMKDLWACPSELTRCMFSPPASVMSVHSQPCESRSLLQVPDVSPVHPQLLPTLTLPRIAPPTPSLSPRALHRQVRNPIGSDSPTFSHTVESQGQI